MTKMNPELENFLHQMPKAEIHIHLEGSMRPETALTLAERNDSIDLLPSSDLETLRSWFKFRDFDHFLEIYLTLQDLLRTGEDFELIAYQAGAEMAAENIRYREITFTPYTHTDYSENGLPIEEILEGLAAGAGRAKEDFGVEIRWIFDIPRNLSFLEGKYDPQPAEKTLAYALQGRGIGVVGLGLGGSEVNAPPELFAHAFVKAKENGLLSVPHAGETQGPASVWGAIDQLMADRIGHGVRAIEDQELITYLVEYQIPLEVNPSSNIHLHVYESFEQHPIKLLDQAGVKVTVNSDDPPLFDTSLLKEYFILAERFDYQQADLIRIGRQAYEACGADDGAKKKMLEDFDRWVERNS